MIAVFRKGRLPFLLCFLFYILLFGLFLFGVFLFFSLHRGGQSRMHVRVIGDSVDIEAVLAVANDEDHGAADVDLDATQESGDVVFANYRVGFYEDLVEA